MRKSLIFITTFFIGFLINVTCASALTLPNIPDGTGNNSSILGENQSYSVTFRGNGEAIVLLKSIFTNLQNSPITQITLQTPNVKIQDISVFQVTAQPQCVDQEPIYSNPPPTVQNSNTPLPNPQQPTYICKQYQQPDFQYLNNAIYDKADYSQNGNTVVITLPHSVNANQTGAYILAYHAYGFASKNILGTYDFTFETLKVRDNIQSLQVGISTDADQLLKGARGTVNYSGSELSNLSLPSLGNSNISSPQFDNLFNQVGQGSIVKNATNLEPMESYTVKGSYADSNLKLYAKEIITGLIIILLIILAGIFITKRLSNRFNSVTDSSIEKPESKEVKNLPIHRGLLLIPFWIIPFWISFISSILIPLYSVLIFWVTSSNIFSGLNHQIQAPLGLFMIIISLAIYAFLFFAPSFLVSSKYGVRWGMGTFGLVLLWLFIYYFLFIGIMFLFFPNSNSTGYSSLGLPRM